MKKLLPALAVSALLLAGCGSGTDSSDASTDGGAAPGIQAGSETTSATSATTAEPAAPVETNDAAEPAATQEPTSDGIPEGAETSLPDDLLPMDESASSRNGETVTLADGSEVTVDGEDVTIQNGGDGTSVVLPQDLEGGVWQYPVEFAQLGPGYLVEQSGGEAFYLSVVFPRDGDAVVATEPDDVPFGYRGDEMTGTLAETWTTGEGAALYTRVRVGEGESLSDDTYRLYTWEAVPDADGGVSLVPTDLGIVCFDDDAQTYEAC